MNENVDPAAGQVNRIISQNGLIVSRLLPAAVINTSFICTFLLLFELLLYVVQILVYESYSKLFLLLMPWLLWALELQTGLAGILSIPLPIIVFVLVVPVMMPILYRFIWRKIGFERSPGAHFLGIIFSGKPAVANSFISDAAVGLAALLLAVLFWWQLSPLVNMFLLKEDHPHSFVFAFAKTALLPMLYGLILGSILLLQYIRRLKNQIELVIDSDPKWGTKLNICNRMHSISMIAMPLLYFLGMLFLTPSYMQPFLRDPASYLFLIEFWVWLLLGVSIVHYWGSRYSTLFYLLFYCVPFCFYITWLPAFIGCIS